ncbi:MAG: ribosome-associated translation inhibitor RaiA [Actinobacteria bacterium]|nr:ribosome-associated translation inhibitor RaiA [Actinomycetota bacterium]
MDITVTGRKMQVSESLRAYANEKVGNSVKVFGVDPMSAEVILHVEKNPANPKSNVAEVTLWMKGHVIRAVEAEDDMYAAIDLVSEKVQRQLHKYKTKVLDYRIRPRLGEVPATGRELDIVALEEEEAVVRTKEMELQPLTEEGALIQIDLLGHDFFVYTDEETGLTNVMYHRKGGGYGIIKPKIETEEG